MYTIWGWYRCRVPLEALHHLRDIGTGDTRPQLFLCDHDGTRERWVLKLMGLARAELVADWVGSLLALRVGIHCPPVAIVSVSETALATAPEDVRRWARPGPAFGSVFVRDAFAGLTDPDMVEFPPDALGTMFALDAWLEVLDRRKPDGIWNVLRDQRDRSLYVLDFGKGLTPCFGMVIGAAEEPVPPSYPALVRQSADLKAALRTCALIEEVDDNELRTIAASVPAAWIDNETRGRIVRFLRQRAEQLRALCEYWLGGG